MACKNNLFPEKNIYQQNETVERGGENLNTGNFVVDESSAIKRLCKTIFMASGVTTPTLVCQAPHGKSITCWFSSLGQHLNFGQTPQHKGLLTK